MAGRTAGRLFGRAGYRPEGTEYTAVAWLRPQQGAAALALVKIQTSVLRHGLRLGVTALRAGDRRLFDHFDFITEVFGAAIRQRRIFRPKNDATSVNPTTVPACQTSTIRLAST